VVAYLQRAEPSLLKQTAPGAAASDSAGGWKSAKPLWIALAILMVLTPLGILAAGSAWGEWAPDDFKNPAARAQIATASGNIAPPSQTPIGIERLSTFWTAPMPRYAPQFLKSASFGYILSAMTGTGIILLVVLLGGRLASRRAP
jgi:cobalt/nickel transport system permease protein